MAMCKDCIHFVVCDKYTAPNESYPEVGGCKVFKATADVVEVVRCEDCKHKEDCAMQMVHTTRDYVLEQNVSTYNKVSFCSYGERRSTND